MGSARTVTIQVPEDYLERLDTLATAANKSVSDIASEALVVYLDAQLWHEAAIERAVSDAANGAIPVEHDRVVRWIESWDTENELPRPR